MPFYSLKRQKKASRLLAVIFHQKLKYEPVRLPVNVTFSEMDLVLKKLPSPVLCKSIVVIWHVLFE